jgi:hypothetical protein
VVTCYSVYDLPWCTCFSHDGIPAQTGHRWAHSASRSWLALYINIWNLFRHFSEDKALSNHRFPKHSDLRLSVATMGEKASVSKSASFKSSVGALDLASVGTILSWFLLAWIGRRTIFVWGLFILFVLLLLVRNSSRPVKPDVQPKVRSDFFGFNLAHKLLTLPREMSLSRAPMASFVFPVLELTT